MIKIFAQFFFFFFLTNEEDFIKVSSAECSLKPQLHITAAG